MMQVSNDASTQNEAISQIHIGIDQISTVVQNNSATAEQSASASVAMEKQAHLLKELVAQFHFDETKTNAAQFKENIIDMEDIEDTKNVENVEHTPMFYTDKDTSILSPSDISVQNVLYS